MIPKIITPNVIRTLQKLKQDPSQHQLDLLVDDLYHDELMELLGKTPDGESTEEFSLKKEFASTYAIIKSMIQEIAISHDRTSEDLKVLNSAQKFLEFILKNEATINGIDSVKDFKEAIFMTLDDCDPILKDKVITKLNEIVEA